MHEQPCQTFLALQADPVALYRTDTYFCMDKSVTAVVIKVGLLAHLPCMCSCAPTDNRWTICSGQFTDSGCAFADVQGLAEHKDSLGAPLCPCRHYDDKQAEAVQGFWNCPCVPMRERKVCCSNSKSASGCLGHFNANPDHRSQCQLHVSRMQDCGASCTKPFALVWSGLEHRQMPAKALLPSFRIGPHGSTLI